MIQNLDSISTQFLANLQLLTQQTSTTEEQLSSGYRINQPSDDPGELGDVLQLESHLGQVNQVSSNLSAVSGGGEYGGRRPRKRDPAAPASPDARRFKAPTPPLRPPPEPNFRSQVGRPARRSSCRWPTPRTTGNMSFAGDQTSSAPYQVDLVERQRRRSAGLTSPSTRLIQDASGVTFAVSQTAQQIFDDRNPDNSLASDNVFAAVNSLRVALANNDQTGITTAITSLQTANDSSFATVSRSTAACRIRCRTPPMSLRNSNCNIKPRSARKETPTSPQPPPI